MGQANKSTRARARKIPDWLRCIGWGLWQQAKMVFVLLVLASVFSLLFITLSLIIRGNVNW